MSPATLEVIQLIGTIIIAFITMYGGIKLAQIQAKVTAVSSRVDLVHDDVNSKMQKALDAQYDLGKADEKAAQIGNTLSKPNKSEEDIKQ